MNFPVKTEGVLVKGFRQEVHVLIFRLFVRYVKLSILDMLPQKVVTHSDVFQVRVGYGVKRPVDRTLVILKKLYARTPQVRQ